MLPWNRTNCLAGLTSIVRGSVRGALARHGSGGRVRGEPGRVELRVDATDKVVEATLLNGWISDQMLQSASLTPVDTPGATFQVQLASGPTGGGRTTPGTPRTLLLGLWFPGLH